VPMHLRTLRKAAVAALHSFNHAQALQQHEEYDNKKKSNSADAAANGTTLAQRKESASQGQGTVGDGTAGGGKVGLELASALNGLELELVAAQRARRRTQVESRVAAREKRRRAELRRLEHDSALEAAQATAAEALEKENKARKEVETLTEQCSQNASLAASASAVNKINCT